MSLDAADMAAFIDPDMPGYVLATIAGTPVGGLFHGAYAESFGIIGGNKPTLRVLGTETVADGASVVIGADHYTVNKIERPLGVTSLQVLILEAA